jgi:peptidoglycan/xylan/chitin deacetylase (PgdA/CDA1 family)
VTTRRRALLAAAAAATAATALAPSPASVGPVRALLTPSVIDPALSGISERPHVALTFDDGPDAASTPAFLRLLDRVGVTATFFVLGRHLRDRGLLLEMVAAGHEIGVHGWDHRPVALHGPTGLRDGLRRTRDLVEDGTGTAVRWYRPPYGVVTPSSWWSADRVGLRTVLWSAWGRDWERRATPASVSALVTRQLRPGGTVLLHDSDRTSAPGSWRTTLGATAALVEQWQAHEWAVGPLRDHWSATSD